ncbi:FumA C-terminus/TtdB family hydratase beta subunit [Terasakiella sp. A23]|uniref:FumA C-terminus/TtdB family hydratase beta subunit n=1 Tax=Terasakiella sp. FCG-A23 TaxID=3080561 RepID=UPI00295461AA|nr:FumA C-terminus/TtdB family hydratase beta subunit [Terasakiella sp. A23]MDV7339476.1 FumA C-terminus/TtdB family hydratase beta subunit [Terasakiella sp. A23]
MKTYSALFQKSTDDNPFRKISTNGIRHIEIDGDSFIKISPEAITALTKEAFKDVSHLLRPAHLQQLQNILQDPDATTNDQFVAQQLLKNAVISAEGEFPSCQDTGTAIISAKKGQNVLVDGDLHDAFCAGIEETWQKLNLRFSQMAPLTMFEEKNTRTNLPAQIDVEAVNGDAIDFLFMAKGGGSANKTFLFQETRRLLEKERLLSFLEEKIKSLGTTACPPYHLAIVIGGLSAEQNLKTVKMASAKELDHLVQSGDESGRAFRDVELEREVLEITRSIGLGAQFGGKYFCHDIRIIRLPRHGGSLPVGIGVSCSADRQIKGRIDRDGVWLEALEREPQRYLQDVLFDSADAVKINLDEPMSEICDKLSTLEVSTPVLMSGTMIVARDLVHAELAKQLSQGKPLPDYMKEHPIYYAGPAKTPEGRASGSFGPTTAARMDPYVRDLQQNGASLVMIAKGNRSRDVVQSCKDHNGFFLGSVGGAAAVLGRDVIKKIEQIDFEEFGMEAVFKIVVQDFPAFVVIDNKGNDFFTS